MFQDLNEILLFLHQHAGNSKGILGRVLRLNIMAPSNRFDRYLMELIEDGHVDINMRLSSENKSKLDTDLISFSISKKGVIFIEKGGYEFITKRDFHFIQPSNFVGEQL
jgi:hypothetical protein